MAPKKTIYVKDADVPLWERFENAVECSASDSVSSMVADAMRAYLDQFGDQGDGLYVQAPDECSGEVTFGEGRTAILAPDSNSWVLFVEEKDGSPESYVVCSRHWEMKEAIGAARRHLSELRLEKEPFESIEVECEDRDTAAHTERFVGRWLVSPDPDETRAGESDFDTSDWDAGTYWGIAQTRRGQFAVYTNHCNRSQGHLDVFPNLDALRHAIVPPSILALALAEFSGDPLVIDRDI